MAWIAPEVHSYSPSPNLVNADHLIAIRRGEDYEIKASRPENTVILGTCEGVYADGSTVVLYRGLEPWRFMSGLSAVMGCTALELEIKKRGKAGSDYPGYKQYGQQ